MAEVINLRLARKAMARQDARAAADANRAKFGEPKAARDARRREADRADRAHDGAKRED
ncbi:MAG: DUF4169 family protein [Sphingomonadales bacterium]|nr:DUF4169 family protein [Sphingomonadales bacterium]